MSPSVVTPREVPALAPPRRVPLPRVSERTLANGLRVLAVRRSTVPLVHLRLRIPSATRRATELARSQLLARSMFLGTRERNEEQLGDALQAIGGDLRTSADADGLTVAGMSLAAELPALLDLLSGSLTGASYPRGPVERETARLAGEARLSASQAESAAADIWARRRYGDHPYGRRFAEPQEVLDVPPGSLRAQHRRRVGPQGAVLVVVGDVAPARALDLVERRLGSWTGQGSPTEVPAVPELELGPLLLVDRPGSVQANLRLGGDAPGMTDPSYAATRVADAIFTGLFSSRLVANLREDKGYTYGSFSTHRLQRRGAYLAVGVDVATDVAAPALVETLYELGRIVTLPPSSDEVESAVQYLTGITMLRAASQSGLAGTLLDLAVRGLDASWLRDHPASLAKVRPDDVLEAARGILAPARMLVTVLGDAEALLRPLSEVTAVTAAAGA